MKKTISILLAIIMLCGSFACMADTQAEKEISVIVDGEKLLLDVSPLVVEGRTLIPLRAAFEALNAKVEWDEAASIAKCVHNDIDVEITIGSRIALVNGVRVVLDVAAVEVNGRILVPLRFVAETLEADVEWTEQEQTVYITTKQPEPEKAEKPEISQPVTPVYNNVLDIERLPKMELQLSKDEDLKTLYEKMRQKFDVDIMPRDVYKFRSKWRAIFNDEKKMIEEIYDTWNDFVYAEARKYILRIDGNKFLESKVISEKIEEIIKIEQFRADLNFRIHLRQIGDRNIIVLEQPYFELEKTYQYTAMVIDDDEYNDDYMRYYVGNKDAKKDTWTVYLIAMVMTYYGDEYSYGKKYYHTVKVYDGDIDSFADTVVAYMTHRYVVDRNYKIFKYAE